MHVGICWSHTQQRRRKWASASNAATPKSHTVPETPSGAGGIEVDCVEFDAVVVTVTSSPTGSRLTLLSCSQLTALWFTIERLFLSLSLFLFPAPEGILAIAIPVKLGVVRLAKRALTTSCNSPLSADAASVCAQSLYTPHARHTYHSRKSLSFAAFTWDCYG